MIAGDDDCLLKIVSTPIPEGMPTIIFIAKITDVTGEYQHVTDRYQRILFEPLAILVELQMEIRCILYFHNSSNFELKPTPGRVPEPVLVNQGYMPDS